VLGWKNGTATKMSWEAVFTATTGGFMKDKTSFGPPLSSPLNSHAFV